MKKTAHYTEYKGCKIYRGNSGEYSTGTRSQYYMTNDLDKIFNKIDTWTK